MQHSVRAFRPTRSDYAEFETGWTPAVAATTVIWLAANGLFWGILPFVGVLSMLSIFVPVFFILYMTRTHEEWPLGRGERQLWAKYNNLDPEVRAKIALDIPTIRKISRDEDQWKDLERAIRVLIREQKDRKREEARLDPTTVVVLDSIKQATEEERQYRDEIKRVLGDFEKAETPQERARLSERMRLRIPR